MHLDIIRQHSSKRGSRGRKKSENRAKAEEKLKQGVFEEMIE